MLLYVCVYTHAHTHSVWLMLPTGTSSGLSVGVLFLGRTTFPTSSGPEMEQLYSIYTLYFCVQQYDKMAKTWGLRVWGLWIIFWWTKFISSSSLTLKSELSYNNDKKDPKNKALSRNKLFAHCDFLFNWGETLLITLESKWVEWFLEDFPWPGSGV